MVHSFINNGRFFALDVESGALHELDELSFNILGDYEKLSKEELLAKYPHEDTADIIEDIEELKKSGSLFTEADNSGFMPAVMAGKGVVKALCLHAAHDCNLGCRYCFAGEGEYHGARGLMSYETGAAALDFVLNNSGARKNIEVDFFGGEPLMNLDTVKRLVEYGRKREKEMGKNFRFTLTTNALLLDEKDFDWINSEMDNVVLSIDGRPEVNDRMRPTRSGKGSYELIMPKIKAFVKSRGEKDHYLRGTFTRYNLDFAQDVLHIADLGFKNISFEPVVAPLSADYAIRREDIPRLLEEYDFLAKEMLKRRKEGRGFNFFHFNIDLSGGPCVIKRLRGCGAGSEYLAVTPAGELYPCHQFVGIQEFICGNVFNGITNASLQDEFAKVNVYNKPACRECFAKYYCSGGCAANAYQYGGSINEPYSIGCELLKKRVECAIMLKYS